MLQQLRLHFRFPIQGSWACHLPGQVQLGFLFLEEPSEGLAELSEVLYLKDLMLHLTMKKVPPEQQQQHLLYLQLKLLPLATDQESSPDLQRLFVPAYPADSSFSSTGDYQLVQSPESREY